MESSKYLQALILIALSVLPQSAFAYNFLYIHPTTGEPIGWEPGSTITYYLDPGSLGRLTNEQAHTLLKEAIKIWETASENADVPHFVFGGYLAEDINGTNYSDTISLFPCYGDDLSSCPTQAQKDLQTVIVFDENLEILGQELCRIIACSANAGAKVISGSSSDPGDIVQGIAVFGPNILSSTFDQEGVAITVGVMVHELGHLLGLAHSIVNQEIYLNGDVSQYAYLPTMVSDSFGSDQVALNPDDIAGITTLYPSATASSETATIKGEILKSDSSPMMHVNVIARNIDDPLCEAYSFLAGRQCHPTDIVGTCLLDENDLGRSEYIIEGLPPGSYTLEVEEVDDSIGSTLAPGLVPQEDIYGDSEFWNESDAASESNTLSSVITLTAGETKANVDIIINRSEVTDDRVKNIPLDSFTAGPASRCQPSATNYASLIGIDDSPDSSPGSGGCSLLP